MTSDRVDQLDNGAEVFYRRLLSKVDDHGLYDARPSILRANLYPLRLDRVREADISRWMAACQKAGLIALYENGGKPYLMALDTRWEKRSAAKFPLPPENIGKQPLTLVNSSTVVEDVVVDEGGARKRGSRKTPIPADFAISVRVTEWAVKEQVFNLEAHFEAFVSTCKAKGYTYVDWDEAFMNAVRKDWARIGKGRPVGKQVAI